jgi:ATP-dependent RNA helicase RhlE
MCQSASDCRQAARRGRARARESVPAGIAACTIHGNKSQCQRERSLEAFRGGRVRALVATDIAARGLDIDGVTHVVNFELPEVAEAYVHRIGRTARAGAAGIAISLCEGAERALLRNIEKLTACNCRCLTGAALRQQRRGGSRRPRGRQRKTTPDKSEATLNRRRAKSGGRATADDRKGRVLAMT